MDGRDITQEVEETTGSAGASGYGGDDVEGNLTTTLNPEAARKYASQGMIAANGPPYRPSPEEQAEQAKRERAYQRQNMLSVASQSFGDKLPLVSAQQIVERAREFTSFVESED